MKFISNTLKLTLASSLLSSCTFWFYNYRTSYEVVYHIPESYSKDEIGKFIYERAKLENKKFYSTEKYYGFDSLVFYGPDYHTLKYTLLSVNTGTIVTFDYFGYSGWRNNPPRKNFIEEVRTKLLKDFNATEVIYKNVNNEKKKSINQTRP